MVEDGEDMSEEIEKLRAERDELFLKAAQYKNALFGKVSGPAEFEAWEKNGELQIKLEKAIEERDAAQKALKLAMSWMDRDIGNDELNADYETCRNALAHAYDCGKGYHSDEEWRVVVEALSNCLEHVKVLLDIDGRPMDMNDRDIISQAEQAIAHAEKLLK